MSNVHPVRECRRCHRWRNNSEFTWRRSHCRKSNWCRQCITEDRDAWLAKLALRREVIADIAAELGELASVPTLRGKRRSGTGRQRREPSRLFATTLINVLGRLTLEEIGQAFAAIGNPLTRERVRQIEAKALRSARPAARFWGWEDWL